MMSTALLSRTSSGAESSVTGPAAHFAAYLRGGDLAGPGAEVRRLQVGLRPILSGIVRKAVGENSLGLSGGARYLRNAEFASLNGTTIRAERIARAWAL